MDSPTIESFRQAFFGPIDNYLSWHDGFDSVIDVAASLGGLTPAEKEQAAAELILALEHGPADARVVLGLAYLRHRPALPALNSYMPNAANYVLQAISQIDSTQLDLQRVARVLEAPDTQSLIDVLTGLGYYYTHAQLNADIVQRIINLLTHPDYLVRYHALQAARNIHGVPGLADDLNSLREDPIFANIISDKRPRDFRRAQELLLAEIRKVTGPDSRA
ncbi:hypothetical protein DNI29_05440 [Hymenobacter sediminis]|uniref:hypothetical protein n=1 Tax=Hymenobacter sediminis TaxID=2218621 RepID=UPI000DA65DB9|nr:hypothetical protein [Hymenobacter sediminis]RPD50241.1 hypothetical protein DNI29_05440 [Hymenobacter sediminis]